MNADRRNRLRAAKSKLEIVRDDIAGICNEEDECRSNMPENLAGSERYERSEECSDMMEAAIASIDDAIGSIEEAI